MSLSSPREAMSSTKEGSVVVVIVDRVERVASLGANRRAPEAGAARFIPGTHPVALDAARVRREGGDQFGCRNDASTPTRRCPVVGAVTTRSQQSVWPSGLFLPIRWSRWHWPLATRCEKSGSLSPFPASVGDLQGSRCPIRSHGPSTSTPVASIRQM